MRMARLCRHCDLQVSSDHDEPVRKGWRVQIACRANPAADPVVTSAQTLGEALDEALTRADFMGWLNA